MGPPGVQAASDSASSLCPLSCQLAASQACGGRRDSVSVLAGARRTSEILYRVEVAAQRTWSLNNIVSFSVVVLQC